MSKIIVFNQVSIDCFIADRNGDMSWAHKQDPEWNEFVGGNIGNEGALIFGRITYQMMASFWPTAAGKQAMPAVAAWMNNAPKVVFSRTLERAEWENTTLLKGDPATEARRLKQESRLDFLIFGSGTIVSQLAAAGLIDEYRLVVNPVVLGQGRPMFATVSQLIGLKRTSTRAFENGNVLLCYERAS